jgi:formylglycine-generating enzyme required for sulfatase activity
MKTALSSNSMTSCLPWLLVGFTALSLLSGCPEGLKVPEPTEVVRIHEALTFTFGNETLCQNANEANNPCESDSTSPVPLHYPQVIVELPDPFLIHQHEVTNDQYAYCVQHGGCSDWLGSCNAVEGTQASGDYCTSRAFKDHPAVQLNWSQADAYCRWIGMRLPTEFEWERAARGINDRPFPAEDLQILNKCSELSLTSLYCAGDRELKSFEQAGQDHVYEGLELIENRIVHLFGNVSEWTSTPFIADVTCQLDANGQAIMPCDEASPWSTCESDCPACDAYVADGCFSSPPIDPPPQPGDEGYQTQACFYLCDGTDKRTYSCLRPGSVDTVYTPDQFTPTASAERTVRGGSAVTNNSTTCDFLPSSRKGLTENERENWLGFRCACDDKNNDGECDPLPLNDRP